ncbi:MAG TPA: reverse transcriptase-like protein [Patescibacteria group bacterium]|nr:reverse transcriptase-like protein [Patescibacteria group bacterium]
MWQNKENSLYKKFKFKNFEEAFSFIEKIAQIAQSTNHHPEFKSNYDEVEIWLTTHSEGGITNKDHKFTQKIDEILSDKGGTKATDLVVAKLFTDGGSRGNPGPSAIGFVILDMEDNVVKKFGKYIGDTTNNQAEYQALQQGLISAQEEGVKKLEVYMDSLLIVNQIKGLYKVKNAELMPLYQDIKVKANEFEEISFIHVPRALNKIADELVNEALDNRQYLLK